MSITKLYLVGLALTVVPVLGQPREWSDSFTTTATYDSASLYAPCSGGVSTKYSMIEGYSGDIFNEHAVSGDGTLRLTSRQLSTTLTVRYSIAAIGVLDVGQSCPDSPDPNPGASLITNEPFTSDHVCIYGGMVFTPWHLHYAMPYGSTDGRYGSDGKPGIAGIDDDLDGTTDEDNETLALRPTPVRNGYGHAGTGGYQAGQDARPGVAGVDDDGSGVVDDIGETGWSGSDDGDDCYYAVRHVAMNGNFSSTSFIYLNFDPGASTYHQFSIISQRAATWSVVEGANEIVLGYLQPYRHYNYVYCSSGSCYGAMLWAGTDMANPAETLGPAICSSHTGPSDATVGFALNSHVAVYQRQGQFGGSSNFGDTFWVISGDPAQYYPSPSADLDRDRDVDGFDFLTFSNCYNGSNKPALAACASLQADLDDDGDVDGFDFLTFSNCYNGSNRRPLAACFPPNLTTCP